METSLKTLIPAILFAILTSVPARAETVDVDFSLWLNGSWICQGVRTVETGEDGELCEGKSGGRTVQLRGEVSTSANDRFEILGRVIETTATGLKIEKHKFVVFTLNEGPAELTESDDGKETLRLTAEIVR